MMTTVGSIDVVARVVAVVGVLVGWLTRSILDYWTVMYYDYCYYYYHYHHCSYYLDYWNWQIVVVAHLWLLYWPAVVAAAAVIVVVAVVVEQKMK